MNQCGAITYDGRICKRFATRNGRCHWHGGLVSRSDKADPQPNAGKWSNALPYYLVERYESTNSDPNQLSVKGEIALVDARIEDLLERVTTTESHSAWADLTDAYEKMIHGLEYGLHDEERTYRAHMREILTKGITASTSWVNIQSLIEQRRRLVECERRGAILTAIYQRREEADAVRAAYQQILSQHLTDPELCNTIHTEVENLLNA